MEKRPKVKLAIESTFKDVEKMIQKLVTKFRRSYHIPSEEAWSAAGLGFAQAFDTYRPELKIDFNTWVHWKVESRLLDLKRDIAAEHLKSKLMVNGVEHLMIEPAYHPFDPKDLFRHLGLDGIRAVTLALVPPTPMRLEIKKKVRFKPEVATRKALVRYLKSCGWSTARIEKAFASIRRAL